MRRTVWWIAGVGCLGVAFAVLARLQGRGSDMATAAPEAKAPASQPASPAASDQSVQPAAPQEEKIIFTFETEDKMKEFGKLWQQRQGIVVRMSVLQAYWNEEQTHLTELNKNLETDYKLDVSKNYSLDTKRRVIIERPTPATPEVPAQPNKA